MNRIESRLLSLERAELERLASVDACVSTMLRRDPKLRSWLWGLLATPAPTSGEVLSASSDRLPENLMEVESLLMENLRVPEVRTWVERLLLDAVLADGSAN